MQLDKWNESVNIRSLERNFKSQFLVHSFSNLGGDMEQEDMALAIRPPNSSQDLLVLEAPEKQDKLNKKDSPRYQVNPFMGEVHIKRGSKKLTVGKAGSLVNTDTGEVNATEISMIKQVDRTEFVKLFSEGVKRFFELSPSGAKLLAYVLKVVQEYPGTDRISLHFMDYMERFPGDETGMKKTTFYRGFTELLTKGFLAQSVVPNLYYINPKLFFNGDRAKFVMDYQVNEETRSKEQRKAIDDEVEKAMNEKTNRILEADRAAKATTKPKRRVLKA